MVSTQVTTRATVAAMSALLAMCTGCVINAPTSAPNPAPPAPPQASATAQTPGTSGPTKGPETAPPSPPAKIGSGPGTYSFVFNGAVGTIEVPARRLDPRLQRFGDYRRLAKAPPITYLIAQVDNRSADDINMYRVVVVSDDGRQIEATSISDHVNAWRNAFAPNSNGAGGDTTKYNIGTELSNNSNFLLHPGAKGTAILGATQPITSVTHVFVYPAGIFDSVEARHIN